MHHSGVFSVLARLTVFFAAFGAVAWFMIQWKVYSGDFLLLFVRTENWGSLVFFFVVGTLLGKILEILLQWLWHNEFVPRARRHVR